MKTAYILAAYRTPGCRAYKGKFKNVRPDDLAASAIQGLVERTGIEAGQVEDVILGCAFPEAEQGWDVARVAAMKAGLPTAVPGMTVNRLCSSGLQAIALAAERIQVGGADCIIAGGVESMTCVPLGGNKVSPNPTMVNDWPESFMGMGMTAEIVAEKYGISREQQDVFAAASHEKATAAITANRFAEEIIPIRVEHAALVDGKMQKKTELVSIDDGVRAETSVASLAKLRPIFKLKGVVTAGNASQMTDGAAAVMVVSEEFIKRINKDPIARFIAFAVKGVPPEVMGIGPIEAIPAALKIAGLKQDDIGLIELNEAFAAQSLAIIKNLQLNQEIINVNGGAIALGHPLGCTGAKLTATLLSEMGKRDTRYGMVSMCVGLGMGAAGIFEKL
ncbi:MAG: acetyl-CoA C-acyltransferase [Desulfuromusa sp.]|nr:acetyl-CoA C-acyltransferase [Desulfuromusa sp.]